jgi:hypothetical protein
VCTTSYATLTEYVTLDPETLAAGATAAKPEGTMLTAAVVPDGSDAEKLDVSASVWPNVTTLTPRVVELIVGNSYTSELETVNVLLEPYTVVNSNATDATEAAV